MSYEFRRMTDDDEFMPCVAIPSHHVDAWKYVETPIWMWEMVRDVHSAMKGERLGVEQE